MTPQTGQSYATLALLGALALLGYKEVSQRNVSARQFLAAGAIGAGAMLVAPVAPGVATLIALVLLLVTARSVLGSKSFGPSGPTNPSYGGGTRQ